MNIEAMKLALEALQGGYGNTKSWHKAIESAIKALRTAIQQAEAQQPATGEPVAIGYINEMDELVKYPAPCIWMGQDCPRAKADRATHECYQRIYTHPAPSVPATGEPVVSRNPFASRCYTMSESHLSGHRLIVGFEKLGDAQDAHEWVTRQGRGDFTHPAPSVPEGYVLVPIEPTQAMMNVQTWDFSSFYSPREIWAAMLAAKEGGA